MTSMATTQSPASLAWTAAMKLRRHLMRQLEKPPKDDIPQFELIDSLLEKFRLTCVQTIFLDFNYAMDQNTEGILWGLHTSINQEYRRVLSRFKQPSQAVEKRKVEKIYINFLRIAQKFYMGYIQRLSARYDIPELKRVAMGIDVELLNADDTISPVPAEMSAWALDSCHGTLIRLGDLARYRVQARHKKSGYEMALTHYSLAHDLMPDSGYAFHQMGIINLDEGKHLDVTYHFYRAWAVETPHPNAQQNLESEFRSMQLNRQPNARNGPPAPFDAFIRWFVQLHARFYKGEVFPQHAEMEGEVIHRLDMACKSASALDVLTKMTLTNLSACHIASTRYAETQSPTASRFCQYTLRLNCRFILTFCTILEAELTDIVNRETVPNAPPDTKSNPIIETVLPLLRTYTMWLTARRLEIFGAADALGSVVPEMVKALAKVFTMLCTDTYTGEKGLASCPYLLPEDVETRGLSPLGADQVPVTCRAYVGEDGALKPHRTSAEERLAPFGETLARILDILRCASFLAEDGNAPLVHRVTDRGLIFEYREHAGHEDPTAPLSPMVISSPVVAAADPGIQASTMQPIALPGLGIDHPAASFHHVSSILPTMTSGDHQMAVETNGAGRNDAGLNDAEETVLSVLAPFLEPPAPEPRRSLQSPEESSYGMHTATANDVFGQLPAPEPSPGGSIPSGRFEPLPWNWVYTPTPRKRQEAAGMYHACREAFSAQPSPNYSSRGFAPRSEAVEDLFNTPSRNGRAAFTPRSTGSMMGSPPVASTAEEAHRNHLLQSLTAANAPRTSGFSHWAQNTPRNNAETVTSPYRQKAPDAQPLSSGMSVFSHPSSLYQGTPANGAGFAMPPPGSLVGNRADQAPSQETASPSASRRFQMDDTTSMYDATILQAAYYGNNR
ncbi:hypothetical protein G7046_g7543 [Stylonectria norvegica]|nr:hypothetical protein G7046_g7543 [Stylonectria norvegica]